MQNELKCQKDQLFAEEDLLIDFQFAVIDALKNKNMRQSELAEKIGVKKSRVSQLLSSDANPTLKLVGRVCRVLDIQLDFQKIIREDATDISIAHQRFKRTNVALQPSHGWERAILAVRKNIGEWDTNDNYAEIAPRRVQGNA